ncbi:MAG: hypothetical protein RM049_00875 [Nostoc sp. DedQUE04]|nr:hypothetical protein [Nostoc sp. DedQUE04]MDZ8133863.1 hypothetical protein [Nostoc sp. DedQUE04]
MSQNSILVQISCIPVAASNINIFPYGWFTDEWLNQRLVMLRSLDDSDR